MSSSLDSSIYLQGSYIKITSNSHDNSIDVDNNTALRNSCDRINSIQQIIDNNSILEDKTQTKFICQPCCSDIQRKIVQYSKHENEKNELLRGLIVYKQEQIQYEETDNCKADIDLVEKECSLLDEQGNELIHILEIINQNNISNLKPIVMDYQLKEQQIFDSYEEDKMNISIDNLLDHMKACKAEIEILQKLNSMLEHI